MVDDAIMAHQQMKDDLICAYAPMTSRKSRSVSSSSLCNVDSLAEMLSSLKCLNLRGRLCGCAQKWPKCCRPAKAPASIKTIKAILVVIGLMCPHAVNWFKSICHGQTVPEGAAMERLSVLPRRYHSPAQVIDPTPNNYPSAMASWQFKQPWWCVNKLLIMLCFWVLK